MPDYYSITNQESAQISIFELHDFDTAIVRLCATFIYLFKTIQLVSFLF
jgi:hypothetical protein